MNPEYIKLNFRVLLENSDVSKTTRGVGAGFLTRKHQKFFKLSNISSLYNGELVAIFKALEYANENHKNKYMIITDSQSAIMGLKQQYPDHQVLQLIKRQLHFLQLKTSDLLFCFCSIL